MIKSIFLSAFLVFGIGVFAQIPAGYYDSAIGDTGISMKVSLHNIIKAHTVVSYSSLVTHHQVTDKKPNGKVWDMYSDLPGGTPPYEFTFITDKCGNYVNEGDCYNREHSFPQSWFSSSSPMKSDLFHVYPTDGKVNGYRSSYPYGEVSNPTKTSLNGSKLGPNTSAGYSGTVFEPLDEYKGDFARTYFYMATRYYNEDGSWPGSVSSNGAEPKPWALALLYQWHLQDTVSQKEIDRNTAVYGIQNNRNPFIDHPEWVDTIWFYEAPSPSSVENIVQELQAIIAPNPVNNQLSITVDYAQYRQWIVRIYDIQGRLISMTHKQGNSIQLNTQGLEAGPYILNIQSTDMMLYKNLKFIKQ
ncbi:MAG: endonuclease [Bacteroidales bacterium]|nr:endonuclease [Bacteroidales bacterium]